MKRKFYYIIKLNFPTLLKIIKENKKQELGEVTYVETTGLAALGIQFFQKLKALSVPFRKIEPRSSAAGPVLYLSRVRNDKDEVVALDFYHEILRIRKEIAGHLKESFEKEGFFKDPKMKGMMLSCFGLGVAQEITAAVCLAFYAKWRKVESGQADLRENILIQTGKQWHNELETRLIDKFDRVLVVGRIGQAFDRWNLTLKNTGHALVHLAYLSLFKVFNSSKWRIGGTKVKEYPKAKGKIMISYRMGVAKDKRNDITYYHSSTLDFKRLLILVKSKGYIPPLDELEWIRNTGVTIYTNFAIDTPNLNIPLWNRSVISKILLVDFYRQYLRIANQCLVGRKKNSLWMLEKYWEIEKTGIYWKDFFQDNNVKILVNSTPSEFNFVPNMAMAEIGGMAVEFERSIRFDYCTYIHNSPNHIYFATGPYSLTQTPEPSFSKYTILTGGINIIENPKPIPELAPIREKTQIILTVFDELPNDIFFGDSVIDMYRIILEVVKKDPRFGLIIKTKKPQIIENMEDVYPEILRLCNENRCLMADWRLSPSTAIKNGDLVVGVISTAIFESVLLGAKTIIYNPMKSGSKIFYSNNGLNRRVFEDKQSMIAALERFGNGTDDNVGDCRDIIKQIDPFGDEKGSERMGQYLEWCLDAFDGGMELDLVLESANKKYSEKWGNQNVASDDAYEIKN